jgi:hypothetical protein
MSAFWSVSAAFSFLVPPHLPQEEQGHLSPAIPTFVTLERYASSRESSDGKVSVKYTPLPAEVR